MASVSQTVLFPDETDVDEEEENNLDEFHRDAWDLDEDFILQQHSKYVDCTKPTRSIPFAELQVVAGPIHFLS